MEQKQPEGIRDWKGLTKAEVLEKILKDDSRGIRLIPGPGYSHKMQTIRSNKVNA